MAVQMTLQKSCANQRAFAARVSCRRTVRAAPRQARFYPFPRRKALAGEVDLCQQNITAAKTQRPRTHARLVRILGAPAGTAENPA
jgi:hypothetical protein